MQKDSILVIRETEAEAEKILRDAEEKAGQMLKETEHSCEVFLSRTEENTMRENEKKLIVLNEKSKALVEKNIKLSEKAAKDFYNIHKPSLHSAVEIILEEIEKQCQ